MSKHSPGPWTFKSRFYDVPNGGGSGFTTFVCDAKGTTIVEYESSNHFDNLLIAAAPELLEALRLLLVCVDRESVQFARTVLAKAEGFDS